LAFQFIPLPLPSLSLSTEDFILTSDWFQRSLAACFMSFMLFTSYNPHCICMIHKLVHARLLMWRLNANVFLNTNLLISSLISPEVEEELSSRDGVNFGNVMEIMRFYFLLNYTFSFKLKMLLLCPTPSLICKMQLQLKL